jgi:hypothetical protein
VRAHADEVGGEGSGGGALDKLEGVFAVDLEPGEFGGCVGERGGDGSQSLVVLVDVQAAQFGSGQLQRRPFEGDGRLSDVS